MAIKTLNVSEPSPQQLQGFKNEVAVLRWVRRRNLVYLVRQRQSMPITFQPSLNLPLKLKIDVKLDGKTDTSPPIRIVQLGVFLTCESDFSNMIQAFLGLQYNTLTVSEMVIKVKDKSQ